MNSMTYASDMAGIDGCGCPMMSQRMGEVGGAGSGGAGSAAETIAQSEKKTEQETSGGGDTMSWLGPILGKVIEAGGKIGASALAPEQKTIIAQQPASATQKLPMGTIAIIGGGLLLVVLIIAMSGKQAAPPYPMPVYYPPQTQPAIR